jgi:hypothetical protein
MVVSLAPQRTLVTGTKTKPVTGTQHPMFYETVPLKHQFQEGDS